MVDGSTTWMTAVAVLVTLGSAGASDGVPTFQNLDQDGNGQVSVDEASARHGLAELMTDYDLNGDGLLNPGEYQKLLEDAAQEMRQLDASNETTQ